MRRLKIGRRARAAIVVVAVLLVAWTFRGPIVRTLAALSFGALTGDRIAMSDLHLSPSRVVVDDLSVTRGADPLASARRIEIRYDLRALLVGGGTRYGLASVAVEQPVLTIVRHSDGTFNVAGPGASAEPGPSTSESASPLRFTLLVRGGAVRLVDPGRVLPIARSLGVGDISIAADIDTSSRTTYRGAGRVAGAPGQSFTFAGRIDADGFALHRIRAAHLDLPPVIDYFVNTPSAALRSGSATGIDVRLYALPASRADPAAYHLAGSATVEGGRMRVPGLRVDAEDMHGRIDAFDDGIASPRLEARLGGIPIQLAGGVFGWRAPVFRLGVAATADLAEARGLFRFSRALPLRGEAAISTLLEGPVGTPLAAVRYTARTIAYDRYPVDRASGRAIYADASVAVLDARGNYGGLAARAAGTIDLDGPEPVTALVVDATGPAAVVPYAAQVAPDARLEGVGLLLGTGVRFDARGVVDGDGGVRLGGTFHVDPHGDGAFGPFFAERSGGERLGGTFYLDRSHNRSGFWFDARDYAVADFGNGPRLPGLGVAAPAFSGRVDAAVAGEGPPSAFRLAGRVHAWNVRVGNVAIAAVSGDAAGGFGDLRLGDVQATGGWGSFRGRGAYAGGRLALGGAYAGTFAGLRVFTGDLGGTGGIAGTVALMIEPGRTIVQSLGLRGAGARVHGVPIDRIGGTIAVDEGRLRVFAATADVAGGRFAAAGEPAGPTGLGVSLASADVATGPPIGPVDTGTVDAIGTVTRFGTVSRFRGGLSLANARAARRPLSANGDLTFDGGRLAFARTDALAVGATGTLTGTVRGLAASAPVYDVALHLPSGELAPVARLVSFGRGEVAGTFGADVHVRGSGLRAAVNGDVRIPEGNYGGLAFSGAAARITIDEGGVRATDGRVTVASTRASFAALADGGGTALRVAAPHADLADFNDLFDAGDTLGGRGRVALRFSARSGQPTHTDADIAITGLRYRRFDLGDAAAAWQSRGRSVTGTVHFGGASGRLDASGVLELPQRAPLTALLLRSRFDGRAELAGLDLGVWLPAIGVDAPIEGRVDAKAVISGPMRDPAVTSVATLENGSIGKFPVNRFTVSAVSTLDRTTLHRVEIELPSVSVVGSGQFGLSAGAPLALALHAQSPNLGALSARLLGAGYPLTGSGTADLSIGGTFADPRVGGHVDVADATLRGVAVPEASAAFSLRRRDVIIRDATVRFAAGSLRLDGSAPFQFSPFSLGPENAPIVLTLDADDVELVDFAPLLPPGSVLRGRVDGVLAVGGTAGAPDLEGRLMLAGGSAATPFETVPLTDVRAEVRFARDMAQLAELHASAGGGTVDASGSIRFADLVHPTTDGAYDVVGHADKLRLDLPAYGTGTVDGTIAFSRIAGAVPTLAGDLRLSDGTIPFRALLIAGAGGGGGGFDTTTAVAPPTAPVAGSQDVAFNLDVSAERNVRVRSANVDIGGRGDLHVGGTRAAPALSGGFTSTGGTITYFNTVFRLIDGAVAFTPDLGVIPTLDARAITHVINPDPNTVRNSAGTADVTLTLAGPVDNLTIGLSSDPAYERQQILGLLLNAPALGASNLFGESRDQATPYGSNTTASLPPGVAVFRTQTGELSVAQEAFGVANAQFTRTLLAPIESTFASAVGLSNFNVNVDYTGNVGVSARKVLGKNLNAVYGSTFGYPYRQTFGFELRPNDVTAAQVTVFDSLGVNGLNSLTPTAFTTTSKLGAAQPLGGTAGFSLSLQRLF